MLDHIAKFKLPLILLAEIILCLTFGHHIPEMVKVAAYSFSVFTKDILVTLLPFLIFSILFANLGNLSKGAFVFTIMAFSCVILSNFCSTMISGSLGTVILGSLQVQATKLAHSAPLPTLWQLPEWSTWLGGKLQFLHPDHIKSFFLVNLLKSVSNDMGLFAGIFCGLVLALWKKPQIINLANQLKNLSFSFFQKLFIPILPLFILGYIINMDHTGVLDSIFENYLGIIALIALLTYAYITLLYGISTSFHPKKWVSHIRELLPAALTGFSTMSSASALPLVIEGVRKNITKSAQNQSRKTGQNCKQSSHDETSVGIVPISINIHLIGDCFAIPILALAILVSFGMGLPSVFDFLIFTVFFVLAKFAVAAIPGGGIIVMIPILEKYLGFTPEMISLITALYILFDPIITSANVFGNGAFAGLFHKVFKAYKKLFQGSNQKQLIENQAH